MTNDFYLHLYSCNTDHILSTQRPRPEVGTTYADQYIARYYARRVAFLKYKKIQNNKLILFLTRKLQLAH